jgi:hypothetical protein
MTTDIVDIETGYLADLASDAAQIEQRFGRRAGEFMRHLPALYRLFHRLSFERALPPVLRRKAASVAVYIAEPQDYLGEACRGVDGLVDDTWLAYSALAELLEQVPAEVLARHWRSKASFDEVAALAPNAVVLGELVPSRVLEQLQSFLAEV